MCGIFGITVSPSSGFSVEAVRQTVDALFRLSESRGKEAAGIAIHTPSAIKVYKEPVAATTMIRRAEYDRLFKSALENGTNGAGNGPAGGHALSEPVAIIGHSRLVTNGSQETLDNNQPVIAGGMVGIHNGIVCNDRELWLHNPTLRQRTQVDTEALLAMIRHHVAAGLDLVRATQMVFGMIEGSASIAVFFEDFNYLLLATNNGSLYLVENDRHDAYVFASEQYILRRLLGRSDFGRRLGNPHITRVEAGRGLLIHTGDLSRTDFAVPLSSTLAGHAEHAENAKDRKSGDLSLHPLREPTRHIEGVAAPHDARVTPALAPAAGPPIVPKAFEQAFERFQAQVRKLNRCSKCVLPETMPFIEFDAGGVCNYCRNYRPMETRGTAALDAALAPYRRSDGKPDCIVTFSGGRDSSYGVHYVKEVLKMNPITYTYDWGMVTDLARRNQARICGKLGIEHILVSADIAYKRGNIRRNVNAWLKRPDLGTIPLFMAGDKQYFWYANELRKQTGIDLVVLCENRLETTGFKTGYCGIRPKKGGKHIYSLSLAGKVGLAAYYAKQYLMNPAYLNRSILDTLSAYACYYIIPHNYLNLFDYIRWEEPVVNETLIGKYNWETATDTKSTWRIGDGTAAFYNYIYYVVAGFSENETFRSNQIREGMLTREAAMTLIVEENRPRWESIKWYCDTIGIEWENAIRRINDVRKRYMNEA
ncbi:glucosamine--fructose-6-phosphate aminotransferase [Phycisphaerae bacterium RAS1]|nr:glucosamine--fructose-6-phosphate aminotransferase [Phycisphaerae bacterium RAS1]